MQLSLIRSFPALSTHVIISLGLCLIFTAFSGYLLLTNSGNFPLAVPLWFSKTWGEQRLAEPVFLWLLPLLSLAVIVINFVLAGLFYQRERLLSSVLIWSSTFISGLFFYTLLEIVSVVV